MGWSQELPSLKQYEKNENRRSRLFLSLCYRKKIVGIVEVIKEYAPDPTDKTKRFGMVTVKALKTLNKAVSLKDIKKNKKLADFIMLKQNRLSVLPVSLKEWDIICKMTQ